MPYYPFLGEGSPTKVDYRKKGALIPTSPLEDLVALRCSSLPGYARPIADRSGWRGEFEVCRDAPVCPRPGDLDRCV